jgi:hypothetical protein
MSRPSAIWFLVVFMGVTAALIYASVVFSTGDPVWFLRRFAAQPERIVITHNGQVRELVPGDPAYDQVVSALNRALGRVDGWEDLGLSAGTLQEYRAGRSTIVEVHYSSPQRVHTRHAFGTFSVLLLPLEGTHSERRVVFAAADGGYRAGALRLESTADLRRAVLEAAGAAESDD